jgi:hypothetical protein
MSKSEVISVSVNISEARSISEVARTIVEEIDRFARKHGVANQFNKEELLHDIIIFLTERDIVGLEELRVSILENGVTFGSSVKGTRIADLTFRIIYKEARGYEY